MSKEHEGTCPNCGYCSHCGRSNRDAAPTATRPIWIGWPPNATYGQGGTVTVTGTGTWLMNDGGEVPA
jgi:hypothetical protein